MTDQTTDRHVAEARRAVHESMTLLPAWEADRVRSLIADLESAVESRTAVRMADAASAAPLPPADQTAPAVWVDDHPQLEAIAAAVWERCGRSDSGMCVEDDPRNIAVAALAAVLPATTNHDTATGAEPPLDPNYSHEACGFHWHGRDGMDIPMRDGQPVCPRCELAKVQKKLDHTQKMRDEVGVECKRRGKRVLEQSERVIALERQVDEVQRQLGAEILRAGQSEAELRRVADETAATETQAATLLRVVTRWAASSESRDVLVEELTDAGYRLPHACGNCEGIDPDTCLTNPDRPATGARQDGAQQ